MVELGLGAHADVTRFERRPGALESAVHRRDAGLEQLCDLSRLPAQDFAEDQNRPLARRQVLQRRHEREPDRLVRDGDLRRVAFGCDGAGRKRLDPGHLRQGVQVRLDRLARRPEIHGPRPALAGVQHVEAHVRRDPVEPRAQRCTALEAVETSPGAEQGLLHGVLGLERRAEHSVAVGGELRTVLFELFLCDAVLDTE